MRQPAGALSVSGLSRRFGLLLALGASLASFDAFPYSTGITGQSTAGCTLSGCHGDSPGTYDYTGSVQRWGGIFGWTTANATIAPADVLSVRFFLQYGSGTVASRGGFNMSATGGSLAESDATIQLSGGELTHTQPRTLTGNDIIFNNLSWTAPSTVGTYTLRACGQPVNFNGTNAGDGPHRCDTLSVTVNTPPNAVDDSRTVSEDSLNSCFSVMANDTSGSTTNESGDSISLFSVGTPSSGGSVAIGGGSCTTSQVRYSPAANFAGTETFTYTIRDSLNATDTATVTVTVSGINDAPVLTAPASVTVTEDVASPITGISFTDIDIGAGSGTVTLSVPAGSVGVGSCTGITVGGSATARTLSGTQTSINNCFAASSVTYTTAANATGSVSMTVTVNDNGNTGSGGALTDSANVTINVTAVNDAPVAVGDSAGVAKNSTDNAIDVLVNDTDVDAGDTKQVIAVNGATAFPVKTTNGSVSLSAVTTGNHLLYTPDLNYSGPDSFTYTMRDAAGLTSSATVDIAVSTGGPPVAMDDAVTMDEDSSQAIAVLANDTDPDAGDTLAVTHINGSTAASVTTTHGSVNRSGNTVTYTPTADYAGADSFTYTITDTSGLTSTATVNITVTNVADAPTLAAPIPDQAATEDAPFSFSFSAGTFTDADAGDTLTYQAALNGGGPLPVWLSFAPDTRTFSGTPANADVGTISVRVTATDSTALSAADDFSITVANVNDPPVIDTSVLPGPALDGQPYSATIEAADPDVGDSLTFSLTQGPAGMTLSTSGILEWTPPCATFDQASGYSVDVGVQVQDEGSATDARTYVLAVQAPDSDGDGMPDCYELANAFDPADPADASGDRDGDGRINLEEYQGGFDPNVDDVAPDVQAPAALTVDATGFWTVVELGQAKAKDFREGEVSATPSVNPPLLRPGLHSIEWSAIDKSGNVGSATQDIMVRPLADFSVSQASGEGRVIQVMVSLNGDPPAEPVTIHYEVSGSASQEDVSIPLGADSLVLAAGSRSGSILVEIIEDGIIEDDESLVFTMTGAINAVPGLRRQHVIRISDGNLAPQVSLSLLQSGEPRAVVYQDQGEVTAEALAVDPDGDAVSLDWSGIAGIVSGTELRFDPAALAPGLHRLAVAAQDTDGASATAELAFLVRSSAPALGASDADGDGVSDATEGLSDLDQDGVPAYLDRLEAAPLLPDQTGDPARTRYLETEPGLWLRLGAIALATHRSGALLATTDLILHGHPALAQDRYDHLGGIYDFELHGLAPGGLGQVVLPLQTALRSGAQYRKFDPVLGWRGFVEDARNAVASARSTAGHCPGPASTAYSPGLTVFHDCVRLTLEDGGPNDLDGVRDGVIRDPGSVGVPPLPTGARTASVSGGALALLSLLVLALLAAPVRRRHR